MISITDPRRRGAREKLKRLCGVRQGDPWTADESILVAESVLELLEELEQSYQTQRQDKAQIAVLTRQRDAAFGEVDRMQAALADFFERIGFIKVGA